MSLRVSGPADTPLRELTVEIVRKRADATNLGSDWVRLDVSGMVRGSALQKDFVLPGGEEVPEGLAVELHPDPTPEVIPHLRELPPR